MKNENPGKPEQTYLRLINNYNSETDKLQKNSNTIGQLRITVFTIGSIVISILFYQKFTSFAYAALTAFLSIFVFLVIYHDKIKNLIKTVTNLLEINHKSIERLKDRWNRFIDTGEEFIDDRHPYSFDLDFFGQGSFFQWINSTQTFFGRKELSSRVIKPEKNKNTILQRQEAVKELSGKIEFRQRLQALGMLDRDLLVDPAPIIDWAVDKDRIITDSKVKKIFLRLLPLSALAVLIIYLITKDMALSFIPASGYLMDIIIAIIVLQCILILKYYKRLNEAFNICIRYKENITTYKNLIRLIEETNFSSEYLVSLKKDIIDNRKRPASYYIKKLETIVDFISLRFSSLHFVLNMLTLWDFLCIIALEKWREAVGDNLYKWLNVIGRFEELSSLSIIHFDNPDWSFPVIKDNGYNFHGRGIGHPLISSKKRVNNDFTCKIPGDITIITGSNMSGKSTMLRTVGINAVLSYTGAPVCADNCECSIMDIYTSMRINDNLEENISTFYAELLRIKMVIEASEKNTILFLLDEVLRGTNTRDRKIGVDVIIKQLGDNGAMGIVATHDVEIAHLKDGSDNINNFYFKETYIDEKIAFDYKLYEGISDTSDAVYLMKMIGIKLDS